MAKFVEAVRPTTVTALWQIDGEQAEDLIRKTLASVGRARGIEGVRQCEFYASADEPGKFLLYTQFDDPRPLASLFADAQGAERNEWINAGTFRGIDADETEALAAGHVTFVRFRLKDAALPSLLAESQADIERTRGVKRFDLNIAPASPLTGMICARWVNRKAWEDHNAGPEYLAMAERMGSLYDGHPMRTLWKSIAAPDG